MQGFFVANKIRLWYKDFIRGFKTVLLRVSLFFYRNLQLCFTINRKTNAGSNNRIHSVIPIYFKESVNKQMEFICDKINRQKNKPQYKIN